MEAADSSDSCYIVSNYMALYSRILKVTAARTSNLCLIHGSLLLQVITLYYERLISHFGDMEVSTFRMK
jgi:hypothetical protein